MTTDGTNQGHTRPEDEQLIIFNGITTPSALIDGRGAPVLTVSELRSTVRPVEEIKGFGTINGETVQQRTERIEREMAHFIRHAEALDA